MRWTERQRAMLREMGIALWAPLDETARDSGESSRPDPSSHAADASRHGADAAVVVGAREVQAREGETTVARPGSDGGARGAAPGRADAPAGAGSPPRADAPGRAGAPARGDAPVRADQSARADQPVSADARARPTVSAGRAEGVRSLPGLAPADWLIVAEPLDADDPQQEQLLDNMLRAIGVGLLAPTRERRAVFTPLPVQSAATDSAAPSTASDSVVATAIDAVAPRCILAFGRAAAATLLGGDAPIGGLRGRVHAHRGVPVVVTFSLPFLLRHPAEKAKAWSDLCLGVATVAGAAGG